MARFHKAFRRGRGGGAYVISVCVLNNLSYTVNGLLKWQHAAKQPAHEFPSHPIQMHRLNLSTSRQRNKAPVVMPYNHSHAHYANNRNRNPGPFANVPIIVNPAGLDSLILIINADAR